MKYLGIDYGLSHTGFAMGDDESRLALPFGSLHEKKAEAVIAEIKKIIAQESVDQLVIGHPLSMQGSAQGQAEATETFLKQLKVSVHIPVHQADERLSSSFARRQKQEDPGSKYDEHALAAASILQMFLDKLKN